MSDNYAVINDKRVELTEEQVKALGIERKQEVNNEQKIEEMMLTGSQKIVAYDGNPAGQHLYDEQRQHLLENGWLLRLPCKVGDTVYCLIAQGRFGTVYTTGEAIARVVSKIIWDGNRFEIYSDRPHYWDNGYSECNFYGYWGDSVFTTKEAAEARLKELREKK